MPEHALPINAMIDGDADRVAAALRRLNHSLVQKQLSEESVGRFAAALELLADDMERMDAPLRTRPFGTVEAGESESDSASWGELLAQGARHPAALRLLLLPGVLLFATVGASYLVADALREAMDPRAAHFVRRDLESARNEPQ